MKNKSPAGKQQYSELLSSKRKNYLTTLNIDGLTKYHNNLSKAATAYYQSDNYNPELRSQQIKIGLTNGKNSIN